MTTFVDRAVLHARAGDGGNGCVSIHRAKYRPLGGPDGGDGGRGGEVLLVVDPGVHTLLDIQFRPRVQAGRGGHGAGSRKHGAAGADRVLPVPEGTVVRTVDGEVLADLVGGNTFVAARGGRGGRGNAALAGPRRKAPGFAELGEPGARRELVLELKSVADVGLVGFPSAGKSSLIAAISAARPKVAEYPFTTLAPHLGVVRVDDTTYTVADVPGLIPGAATGKGLGLEFLRHIERCAVLVHVIDCATLDPGRDPVADLDAIEAELAAYGGLADRPRLVALNKIDIPDGRDMAELAGPDLAARGLRVFPVSAAAREGLRPLVAAMAELVATARGAAPAEPPRPVLTPVPVDDPGFTVTAAGVDEFEVRGPRPERWVHQTNFDNDEAVAYLADRLARLGVEEALVAAGATPGGTVRIAGREFEWEPSGVAAGAHRRTAADRLAARRARRTPAAGPPADGPPADGPPADGPPADGPPAAGSSAAGSSAAGPPTPPAGGEPR